MKILLVHNFYQYRGGEDTYFLALKSLLESHKHTVITFSRDSRDINNNITSKINLVIGLFNNKKAKKEFSEILKREKPDIVHTNNLYPLIGSSIYKLSKDHNIPVIQTVHNYRMICPGGYLFNNEGKPCIHASHGFSLRKIFQNCYRNSYIDSTILALSIINGFRLLRYIDLFLFPSSNVKEVHLRHLPYISSRSTVLPYFTAKPVKKLVANYKAVNFFLYAGMYSKRKGIIELLDIFKSLPDLKLIACGDGPLKEKVYEYRKYKNIKIYNRLPKDRVFQLMQNATYTIIPSKWDETGPMIMYESLSANTPVIIPRIGGFKNIIHNRRLGLFFKFNNYESLRKIIVEASKINRSELSKYIINEYEKKYSPQSHYFKLMKIYKNVTKTNMKKTNGKYQYY